MLVFPSNFTVFLSMMILLKFDKLSSNSAKTFMAL